MAFNSFASDLVSDDTNGKNDVFVRDRQTNTTTRVSVASEGTQGNGYSAWPSISADGRVVAFVAGASNLVSDDTNGTYDIFVHDRLTSETTRVSVASGGTQVNNGTLPEAPSISADGRFVAFNSQANNLVGSDTNDMYDIFVHDRQTGTTTRVSVASDGTQANGNSRNSALSADGHYVTFNSDASTLVTGDTNYKYDVFVHDRESGETTRVSLDSNGTQGNNGAFTPSISADGRFVAFHSDASNLVSGDTNNYCDTDDNGVYEDNCPDIFVHDRQTGHTTRVSVASDGTQGNKDSWTFPSVSADGRYVAFVSTAINLVSGDTNNYCDTDYDGVYEDNCWDVFVHDRLPPTLPLEARNDITEVEINSSNNPIDVLANDSAPSPDLLAITQVTDPPHGTAVHNNGGTSGEPADDWIDYTPDKGYAGPDSFDYTITDGDGGTDTATVSITVIAGTPMLFSPYPKSRLNDATPTFDWEDVDYAASYEIQIARDNLLVSLVQTAKVNDTTYTATRRLTDGVYYWHVRAGKSGTYGHWSKAWSFTIDTAAPTPPPRRRPPDGATLSDLTPTFRWERGESGSTYVFQLAADEAFEIVLVEEALTRPRYDVIMPLLPGTYWWRVAAVDAAGNRSGWGEVASFTLVLESDTPPATDVPPTDTPPTVAPPVLSTPVPTQPPPPHKPGAPTPTAPAPDDKLPPGDTPPSRPGKRQ